MIRPQKIFYPYLDPKNSPLGPQNLKTQSQKLKKTQNSKSKSKVRIEGTKENKGCLTTWVDLETILNPFANPKYSPLGPQKILRYPKN